MNHPLHQSIISVRQEREESTEERQILMHGFDISLHIWVVCFGVHCHGPIVLLLNSDQNFF